MLRLTPSDPAAKLPRRARACRSSHSSSAEDAAERSGIRHGGCAAGRLRARVTRWALVALGALLVLGGATVALARFFGKSGSRASIVVSVVARWLAVYVLWSFAGGLAVTYGLLATYYSPAFAVIGL